MSASGSARARLTRAMSAETTGMMPDDDDDDDDDDDEDDDDDAQAAQPHHASGYQPYAPLMVKDTHAQQQKHLSHENQVGKVVKQFDTLELLCF